MKHSNKLLVRFTINFMSSQGTRPDLDEHRCSPIALPECSLVGWINQVDDELLAYGQRRGERVEQENAAQDGVGEGDEPVDDEEGALVGVGPQVVRAVDALHQGPDDPSADPRLPVCVYEHVLSVVPRFECWEPREEYGINNEQPIQGHGASLRDDHVKPKGHPNDAHDEPSLRVLLHHQVLW